MGRIIIPILGQAAVVWQYGVEKVSTVRSTILKTRNSAKFEAELPKIKGNMGIGCISDTDPQPLTVRSHLGQYAISTVGKINNLDEIVEKTFINRHIHFLETSRGTINPTELVSVIIDQQETFKEGLLKVQEMIQGSCSVMLLTPEGIYASGTELAGHQ